MAVSEKAEVSTGGGQQTQEDPTSGKHRGRGIGFLWGSRRDIGWSVPGAMNQAAAAAGILLEQPACGWVFLDAVFLVVHCPGFGLCLSEIL